jgi:hypothetical protein
MRAQGTQQIRQRQDKRMDTHGHLLDRHSAAMASKVTFSKATMKKQVCRKGGGQPKACARSCASIPGTSMCCQTRLGGWRRS